MLSAVAWPRRSDEGDSWAEMASFRLIFIGIVAIDFFFGKIASYHTTTVWQTLIARHLPPAALALYGDAAARWPCDGIVASRSTVE